MVEIQGKKSELTDISGRCIHNNTLYSNYKKEILKQQRKNETVPDLFYLIIPIVIFKALAMEQPEPLEHILEQHRT